MAAASFEKMFRQDSRTLRTSLAYAQYAAHYGDFKLARQIMNEQLSKTQGDPHPLAKDMLDRINNKEKTALLVTVADGGVGRSLLWIWVKR